MKCFYHRADHDGKLSAAIVLRKHPQCKLIGVDYYDGVIPSLLCEDNEDVFVVDFSFEPFALMVDLAKKTNLVWIDHHTSSFNKFKINESNLEKVTAIISQDDSAACELTWMHLFPDMAMPPIVHLLGRYDAWDHSDPDVVPFEYYMRSVNPTVEQLVNLMKMNDAEIKDCVKLGMAISSYLDSDAVKYNNEYAFNLEFEGIKFLAINRAFLNSNFYVSRKDYHQAGMSFVYSGNKWTFSLRSFDPDVDVAKIAERFGGGGHKSAAGFAMKKLNVKLRDAIFGY